MSGDARLRDAVHFLGADLDLDRHAVRTEQRSVQGLIAIDPRDCDVVLEASGHRLVQRVHDAEGAIARVDRVDDDAESEHVDDFAERVTLLPHLLIDAVEVFLAAFDAAFDRGLAECGRDVLRDLADELFLVADRALQRALYDPRAARIQRFEAELFELRLDRVDPEPVRDRRVDLERLAGDRTTLGRRHRAERAHVVRAVGELDHDHADVADHREQHLAEALGLGLGAAAELDLVELRYAVDEVGDFAAEALRDLLLRGRRVLDHVVQDRRDDRRRIESQVGEQVGDGDRMGYVGFAGQALLPFMGRRAEIVGLPDRVDLVGSQVGFELREELGDAYRASSSRPEAQNGRRVVHGGFCQVGTGVNLPVRGAARAARRSGRRPA